MIAKAILTGRVGLDPMEIGEKRKIVKFSIATDRRVKKGDSYETIPIWHNIVVLYDNLAEFALKHITKSMILTIVGDITNRTYENKEKVRIPITEIIATEIKVVDWGKKANEDKSNNSEEESNEDDLPF